MFFCNLFECFCISIRARDKQKILAFSQILKSQTEQILNFTKIWSANFPCSAPVSQVLWLQSNTCTNLLKYLANALRLQQMHYNDTFLPGGNVWSSLTPICDFKSSMIIWPAHYHIGKPQMSMHIGNLAGAKATRIHRIELLKTNI